MTLTKEASAIAADHTEQPATPGRAGAFARGTLLALRQAAGEVWVWFGSFRRTRPFWGGLWLFLGGLWILRLSQVGVAIAVQNGISAAGGYLTGGGMVLCGLIIWAAPSQRYVAGLIGVVLAVASLVVSNLGGFILGMTLGVLGGAMAFSWGPKRPRKRKVAVDGAPS